MIVDLQNTMVLCGERRIRLPRHALFGLAALAEACRTTEAIRERMWELGYGARPAARGLRRRIESALRRASLTDLLEVVDQSEVLYIRACGPMKSNGVPR